MIEKPITQFRLSSIPEKLRESPEQTDQESTQFEISNSAESQILYEMTNFYENNELDMVLPHIFQHFY